MTDGEELGGGRFVDPRTHLWDYMEEIAVRCPSCASRARVAANPTTKANERPVFTPRRVSCLNCGHAADHPSNPTLRIYLDGRDPYFGLGLWFATECLGHVLWAYNEGHLSLLESFASADVRERGWPRASDKMSLIEKLPSWMKQSKNRSAVLGALARLRAIAG